MKKAKTATKGFTVIEVVLVLALAGLIFLMAFIALPQMQRSQRDAERKDDMMLFTESVKKYMTNNRGTLPDTQGTQLGDINIAGDLSSAPDTSWQGFWRDYIRDSFQDPREGVYKLNIASCDGRGDSCTSSDGLNYDWTIHVYRKGVCTEDHAVEASSPRDFAVLYRTESSGVYCFDSSS